MLRAYVDPLMFTFVLSWSMAVVAGPYTNVGIPGTTLQLCSGEPALCITAPPWRRDSVPQPRKRAQCGGRNDRFTG